MSSGSLQLFGLADLEEIGLPPAIERILVFFGKAMPLRDAAPESEPAAVLEEPMPEEPHAPDLPELKPEAEAEAGTEPEPESEPVESPALEVRQGEAPASELEERILVLLAPKKLEKYLEAMEEEGYLFVDDLLEADDEDIAQLAKDVQMKKPEAELAVGETVILLALPHHHY